MEKSQEQVNEKTNVALVKNFLFEICRKSAIAKPIFETRNEGPDHLPRWKTSVLVNGVTYESPQACSIKKLAESSAATVAIEQLWKNGFNLSISETSLCKNLLLDLASNHNLPQPSYTSTKAGPPHSPLFTAVVEFNGSTYAGSPAPTKREAEGRAAFKALQGFQGAAVGMPLLECQVQNGNHLQLPGGAVGQPVETKSVKDEPSSGEPVETKRAKAEPSSGMTVVNAEIQSGVSPEAQSLNQDVNLKGKIVSDVSEMQSVPIQNAQCKSPEIGLSEEIQETKNKRIKTSDSNEDGSTKRTDSKKSFGKKNRSKKSTVKTESRS